MSDHLKRSKTSGHLLKKGSSGHLAKNCKSGFNCTSPSINGCYYCSCCAARYFNICISGATGDCAVINSSSSGWTVDNGGSGGNYTFQNGIVKITLTLSTYYDAVYYHQYGGYCRTWALKVYRNNSGSLIECLNTNGSDDWTSTPSPPFYSLGQNCDISGTVNGITFTIRPAENWFATKMRLTISGHTNCSASCLHVTEGYPGAPNTQFGYQVNSVSLDGIYEVPLDQIDHGSCYYRLKGVGAYSYTIWSNLDCTGSARTVAGKFNIQISLDSQIRVRITQDTTNNPSAGDDFSSWSTTPHDLMCKTLNLTGQVNYDNRCPLAYGSYANAWVRTGSNATATVVGIP